jgi:transposase
VKFRYVKNPRYNPRNPRSRKLVLCHGLVRCVTCGMLWNRDANAAINMLRIATAAIHGERRPLYLSDKWTDNSTPPAPPPRQIQGQIAGLV